MKCVYWAVRGYRMWREPGPASGTQCAVARIHHTHNSPVTVFHSSLSSWRVVRYPLLVPLFICSLVKTLVLQTFTYIQHIHLHSRSGSTAPRRKRAPLQGRSLSSEGQGGHSPCRPGVFVLLLYIGLCDSYAERLVCQVKYCLCHKGILYCLFWDIFMYIMSWVDHYDFGVPPH